MKWDSQKLKVFLVVFQLKQKVMAEETGIERSAISRLLNGDCRVKFRDYDELLEAYLQSKLAGKRAELEQLIKWYEQRFK